LVVSGNGPANEIKTGNKQAIVRRKKFRGRIAL